VRPPSWACGNRFDQLGAVADLFFPSSLSSIYHPPCGSIRPRLRSWTCYVLVMFSWLFFWSLWSQHHWSYFVTPHSYSHTRICILTLMPLHFLHCNLRTSNAYTFACTLLVCIFRIVNRNCTFAHLGQVVLLRQSVKLNFSRDEATCPSQLRRLTNHRHRWPKYLGRSNPHTMLTGIKTKPSVCSTERHGG
jgi:hypothetical protein